MTTITGQRLQLGETTVSVDAEGTIQEVPGGWLLPAGPVTIHHPFRDGSFYRHGWQSWSTARWIDLDRDLDPEVKADPGRILGPRHGGCWVGAVQGEAGAVLLLGGLGLETRVGADATTLIGRSEAGAAEWFLAYGPETEVFAAYAGRLGDRFGVRRTRPGTIWCSWYSFFWSIEEASLGRVLEEIDGLPIDVFQIDDGWQQAIGDWQPNDGFPAGMEAIAGRIAERGYQPGLWLTPFIARDNSRLFHEKRHLFVVDGEGRPVLANSNWGGPYYGLDLSLPEAQDLVHDTISRARRWGFTYLKLDFIFGGALPGIRASGMPREEAYRRGIEVVRDAAGEDAYLLACGAPIVPSLGIFDAIRIGPDVAPYWELLSHPPTEVTYAEPATRYAISTTLSRLWLDPLIAIDPDVVFFRSSSNQLDQAQMSYLRDMATICGFLATSDPPEWLSADERAALAAFLDARPSVERLSRYRFAVDGRTVDFSPVVLDDPVSLALGRGDGLTA
jgi:alpha-galactosidase